jgi:tryptophan-rich sensory protein
LISRRDNHSWEWRVFRNLERQRLNRFDIFALIGFIGLCVLVGVTAGTVTATSVQSWYNFLRQPPLAPPNWLFGPVWSTLYVLIGTSGWLIWCRGATQPVRHALRLWGWQLLANALWTPAFFGLRSPPLGLAVLLALLVLVSLTIRAFAAIRPLAAGLLVPYFLWGGFATYLNVGIWWLNR